VENKRLRVDVIIGSVVVWGKHGVWWRCWGVAGYNPFIALPRPFRDSSQVYTNLHKKNIRRLLGDYQEVLGDAPHPMYLPEKHHMYN